MLETTVYNIFVVFFAEVTIMVGDKTIAEMEWELAEADRLATEARLKAQALKERLELARQAV